MAVVTLSMKDNPDGSVTITPVFDVKFNPDKPSGAEYLAMDIIMHADDVQKTSRS